MPTVEIVVPPTETSIDPVIAPSGTITNNSVAVAELTVATASPNRTIFSDGVALNPRPEIVTVEPLMPSLGE